jgi:SAM-dependent methyltransferase
MQPYTSKFFERIADGSRRSAREIVPLVLKLVQPRHVVDVGCGLGTWLSVCREYGIDEVFGVDGDYVDKSKLEIPEDRFLSFDLRKSLRVDKQFDLVLSLEVAEHLPGECAETFIDSLTRLGPVVLFSAAIPFQGGTEHVNEQWPDYWVERFRTKGYVVVDCIRKQIWQNDYVEDWYAQNTLMFIREDHLENHPLLKRESENTVASQLSIVHPKRYLKEIEWRHRLYSTAQDIAALIPPENTLILVDDEVYGSMVTVGYRAVPFNERDGNYWGPPPDDTFAIRELERLRQTGADFMVFVWPAFWWLDYYSGLHRHLRSEFRCVLENERLIVFDMRP